MRKELELIETIENYLKGNLSETDKVAFEKKINENPELKKEVELQKQVLKGIERTGLKQSAKQGLKKYKFNKGLKNWGLGGLVIAVIALSSVFVYNAVTKSTHKENAAYDLPELNEQGEKLWSDADKYLEPQNFELNADQDTVVETADGIVIAIPANSFLDANGQPAKGKIQLEVKEALNSADIMKAGLNTKSGDKLLETGGMFYINARQDGASLKIDTKNPLYAEIPTDEVKPGMQLFEGKRLADGSIDWVNPKSIVKDLIPVDILSLNFYPPNYLDSLKSWGYNNKDKKFTDSLYYSFASMFVAPLPQAVKNSIKKDTSKSIPQDNVTTNSGIVRLDESNWDGYYRVSQVFAIRKGNKIDTVTRNYNYNVGKYDTIVVTKVGNNRYLPIGQTVPIKNPTKTLSSEFSRKKLPTPQATIPSSQLFSEIYSPKGINPATIKTIWSNDFQNTLLATRDFEERLPYIFKTCDESILDMYINNLDQNLSFIDSSVANALHPEFMQFAMRGDGKVKNQSRTVQLLKKYYSERTQQFTEAIAKTKNEFWAKQSKADFEAREKEETYTSQNIQRLSNNFQEALRINALTISGRMRSKVALPQATYGVVVYRTGWSNCDRYVSPNAVVAVDLNVSTSMPPITSNPMIISLNERENYDRVLVYLLPDELSSFIRVSPRNDIYEEQLSEIMIYKLVCIAYKGDKHFYFSQDNIKSGKHSVSLIKTDEATILNNINKLSKLSQVKAMNDELAFISFQKEEAKRQVELAKINELTNKVRPVIFPCMTAPAQAKDSLEYSYK